MKKQRQGALPLGEEAPPRAAATKTTRAPAAHAPPTTRTEMRLSSRLEPTERANARRAWKYSGLREVLLDADGQRENEGKWLTQVDTEASGRDGQVAERLWIKTAVTRNGRSGEQRYIETDRIEQRQSDGTTLIIERRKQPGSIEREATEAPAQDKETDG